MPTLFYSRGNPGKMCFCYQMSNIVQMKMSLAFDFCFIKKHSEVKFFFMFSKGNDLPLFLFLCFFNTMTLQFNFGTGCFTWISMISPKSRIWFETNIVLLKMSLSLYISVIKKAFRGLSVLDHICLQREKVVHSILN